MKNLTLEAKTEQEIVLDGSAERILLPIETGKYEVWKRMAKVFSPIINEEVTTKIGNYVVHGRYKFVGYTSRE